MNYSWLLKVEHKHITLAGQPIGRYEEPGAGEDSHFNPKFLGTNTTMGPDVLSGVGSSNNNGSC